MRILVVNDLFPPDVVGGYELRCKEAVEWLIQHGYYVAVLTTESGIKDDSIDYYIYRILKKYPYGATPENWGFFRRLYFAARDNYIFKKIVREFNPDLLYLWHCAGISRTLIPELYDLAIPTIVDVSDKWLYKVWREWGPIYGLLSGGSASVLKGYIKRCLLKMLPILSFGQIGSSYAVNLKHVKGYFTSRWNKDFHVKNLPQCNHFHVFHIGIDLKKFPYKQKESINETISLLYVGQISKEKGFILLLDHLEHASHQNDLLITLVVVGDFKSDDMKMTIQERIKVFNKKCEVRFIGPVPHQNLYKYYHDSHFTVFPSIWDEPFGRVPLESMACGTPCICTDNPGSKELFSSGVPLLLLDRNDKRSLLETIEYFCKYRAEYSMLSLQGRKYVEKNYTFDGFMKKVENIII